MKPLLVLLTLVLASQAAVSLKKPEADLAAGRFDAVIEACARLDGKTGDLQQQAALCRMAALAHLLRLEGRQAAGRLVDAIERDPAFVGNVALLNEYQEIIGEKGHHADIPGQLERLQACSRGIPELAREVNYARATALRITGDIARSDSLLVLNSSVTEYWLGGPYANLAGSGMCRLEDPERGIVDTAAVWSSPLGQPCGWRRLEGFEMPGHPLSMYLGDPQDACAVLSTQVYSAEGRAVRLHVSGQGRARVWLNGQVVLAMSEAQNGGDPLYVLPVQLAKGWNRLLAKTCTEEGTQWIDLQFTDSLGQALDLPQDPDPGLWSGPAGSVEGPLDGLAAWDPSAWLPRWAAGAPQSLQDDYFLGAYLFKRGFRQDGLRVLARITEARPESVITGALRRHLLNLDGQYEEASQALRVLSLSNSQLVEGRLHEVNRRLEEKDLAGARALIAELMLGFPSIPEVQVIAGILRLIDGDTQAGMGLVKAAVAQEPGNSGLAGNLMGLQESTSDEVGRQQTLREIVRNRPDLGENLRRLSYEQFKRDEFSEALELLQAGTGSGNRVDYRHRGRAMIHENTGDLEKALAEYDSTLALRPMDLHAIEQKALLLGNLGREAEARRVRQEAIRVHPQLPGLQRKVRHQAMEPDPLDGIPAPDRADLLSRKLDWLPEGAQAVYIFRRRELLVHPSGCAEVRFHMLARMLAPAAIREFQTARVDGEVELAQTIKADGRLIPAGNEEGNLAFADLQVGDMVELRTLTDWAVTPGLPGQCWFDLGLDKDDPVLYSRVAVSHPEGMRFTRALHNIELEPSSGVSQGRPWMLYEAWQQPGRSNETSGPGQLDHTAWLDLSTVPDWGTIIAWYEDLIAGRLEPKPELQELAATLSADAPDDSTRVRRAAHFAKETLHYQGGQFVNSGHIPRPVREILRTGYGDCKDQSVLLVGLLRAMGIRASVALVNASDYTTTDYLPSQRFTHAIVRAQGRNGQVWWIDPTDVYLPFPDVTSTLEGQRALVIDRNGPGFETIAFDPVQQRSSTAHARVTFPGEGAMAVEGRIDFTGEEASALRYFVAESDPETFEEQVRKIVSPEDPGALLRDWQIRAEGLDSLVAVTYRYELPGGASLAANLLLAPAPWSMNRVPAHLATLEERTTELNTILWRGCFRETLELVLPEGATVLGGMPAVDLECATGEYHLAGREIAPGRLQVTRELRIHTTRIRPADYPAFRDLLRAAWKAENERIVLKLS
jgi:transglutaminase-like putative cysteine protease/tetratricopeptide (TPR) repeat protein